MNNQIFIFSHVYKTTSYVNLLHIEMGLCMAAEKRGGGGGGETRSGTKKR